MSYTKYTTETLARITFYYQRENIFNNVSLRTMYRAKTILNEKGEAMNDQYSMSADEDDAFAIFLLDAVNDAFQVVMKMTTGVTDAIIIDQTVVTGEIGAVSSVTNCYGFMILDEEAYNENALFTVDDGIKKYIQSHILAAWWGLVSYEKEEAKWLVTRDRERADLITNRLFQLRKKLQS